MSISSSGKATDLLQFTRASNATVTDSDGRVKWAPHNLLTNSESFDAAAWTTTAATIAANNATAPNGTNTADKLVESGTLGDHFLSRVTATQIVGVSYTLSWYVKASGRTKIRLYAYAMNNLTVFYDTATNTASYVSGGTNYSFSMSDAGSGWYRCVATSDASATNNDFAINLVSTGTTVNYTGDSSSGVHLWGAHLYRSDLGGMQPNTSAYPMYSPTTPKNLLGYTEDFSNAAWVSSIAGTGVATVVTTNAGIAPNGLQTADRIQFSLGGGSTATDLSRRVQAFSTVSSTPYTLSMWVKSFDGSPYTMHLVSAAGVTVNTVSVTNEWQRVSVTANGFGGNINFGIGLRGAQTPTNSNTADILVWGAQLSDSASLDPYVANHFTAPSAAAYYGPRRDFDGATLACKGLLVEEQRANLLLNSAAFDAASWTQTGVTIAANVAGATAVAPDGTNTADKWQETAGGSGHVLTESASVTTGVTYTFSVYAKAAENSYVGLFGLKNSVGKLFNLSNGTVGNNLSAAPAAFGIGPVGNGWYRCWIQDTEIATTSRSFQIYSSKNGTNWDYSGTLNDGIYIWGAQLEAGSFATSYIPTGAATATRNADVASVSTQAFPYSATEGTLVASGSVLSTAAGNRGAFTLASGGGYIAIGNNVSGLGTTNADFYTIPAGTFLTASGAVTAGTPFKTASVYKASDFAMSVNGAAAVTSSSGALPTAATDAYIGRIGASSSYFNGHIRQITYIPRRLTNAELQTRSA